MAHLSVRQARYTAGKSISGGAGSPVGRFIGSTFATQRTGTARLPGRVRFREVDGRGLIVNVWINGTGAYKFAIDTGAGATILSRRIAGEARVGLTGERAIEIGGLSGLSIVAGQKASVRSLAIGDEYNLLQHAGLIIVADGLPRDVDGILDPTEAYWPLGYTIDMPNGEMSVFEPRATPLRSGAAPPGGAIVPWLFESDGRRPFVMLSNGRRALLDTGSGLGLAVDGDTARGLGVASVGGREREATRDLAGGRIAARRIRPITVQIGSLVLRGVPTDLLLGARTGSPLLLGRDALRPFQLTFDPVNRLIQIRPR